MTQAENVLLLAALVGNESLLAAALGNDGKYQLFDGGSYPDTALLWSAIVDCHKAVGSFPDEALVRTELHSRCRQFGAIVPEDQVMRLYSAVLQLSSRGVNVPTGRMLLNQALSESMRVDWAKQIDMVTTPDEAKTFFDRVRTGVGMLGSHQETLHQPFMTPEKFLLHEDRHPLGLRYIDEVLGGGIAPREMVGLLGPTGGGKTVIATGLAVEQALRRKHVLLVTFEQSLRGDIMDRLCCRMTGLPVSEFRDRAYMELPEEVRRTLDERRAEFGPYLHVLDLSSEIGGGVETITSVLEEKAKRDQLPWLLIVDWLGAAVERQIAGGLGRAKSEDAYRRLATQVINEIRAMQNKLGFSTLMIHQLSTKASRASSSKKPVVTDAYEFKAFAYYMDVCLCLGTLSRDTKVGHLISDKNRRSPVAEILVKLDGANQMFSRIGSDSMVLDHTGNFVPAGRAPDDVESRRVGRAGRSWH